MFVLLGGIMLSLHVAIAGRRKAGMTERRMRELARRVALLQEETDIARSEVEALRARMDDLPDAERLSGELKVLQGLLKQLATRKDQAGGATAAIAAPDKSGEMTAGHRGGKVVIMDGEALLAAIEEALREEAVELYLQPVVSLPQRKRRFYECFSRIVLPNGSVITPEQYIPVAEQAGLVAAIDNLLLVRCVQLVRRARRDHLDVGFFCNISNASLTDVDFFQDFITFMAENRQLAETLVFEFDYSSIASGDYITRMNLQRLRGAGYRFSVDQVHDLDLDLEDLSGQGFRYVKVNAHLLHEMARGDDPVLDMRSFKGALDRHAMDLIVEKIESEDMLLDLLELKVDFGQGYLFGEPRPLVDKQ
ncbi:MAG: EAL domain-containing protein [Thalassobaculaceae bacterium]|nr:EAL domain-containing protein [Thalassobaculaceae bacterium]